MDRLDSALKRLEEASSKSTNIPLPNKKYPHFYDPSKSDAVNYLVNHYVSFFLFNNYRILEDSVFNLCDVKGRYGNKSVWRPMGKNLKIIVYSQINAKNQDLWKRATENTENINICTQILLEQDAIKFDIKKYDADICYFTNGYFVKSIGAFITFNVEIKDDHGIAATVFPAPFPVPLAMEEDISEIPTRHFDSIFIAQKIPKEALETIYIVTGSFLYPRGTYDKWNISVDVNGIGYGKSTYQKILQFLLQKSQTNLSDLHFESTMIKEANKTTLALTHSDPKIGEQALITLNKVFGKSESLPNLITVGKESLADPIRRIIQTKVLSLDFKHKPVVIDQTLFDLLKLEAGWILVKCNIAYRRAASLHRDDPANCFHKHFEFL